MKQRVTYVVKKPENFTPEQIVLGNNGKTIALKKVDAAKEHRFTIGLNELPTELRIIFRQWRSLHIRWVSSNTYTATPPFTSRMSPGLHVFFTPLGTTPENAFCENLHSLVSEDIKCSSTKDSVLKIPVSTDESSSNSSLQYYAYLDSISQTIANFSARFRGLKVRAFEDSVTSLSNAAYIDIDYDSTSRAVILTAVWPDATTSEGWTEEIKLSGTDSRVEVGVLNHEANADPEDIQFGGFLSVLGQDEAPKATRFQTPTRHYPLLESSTSTTAPPKSHPLTYTTSFSHPTGLHPTLILSFPKQHLIQPDPTCKLHTHLTLPSYLFIDKYQFEDTLFLQSKNLKRLRSLSGATDLEAPDWVVKQWGSAALFQIAHPDEGTHEKGKLEGVWNISIPLHLRYMPALAASHTPVPVPWPVVFWACDSEEGEKMAGNPFDRVNLGYEALFKPETRFMHVEPTIRGNGTRQLVEWIRVPVLDTRKTGWVEVSTISVVSVAFFVLCWCLFGNTGGAKKEEWKRKKKQ